MSAAPAASDCKVSACGCGEAQKQPQTQSAAAAAPAQAGQKGAKRQAKKQH
jgi:hypothetical protein